MHQPLLRMVLRLSLVAALAGAAAARGGDVAALSLFKAAWYVQTEDAEPELIPQAQDPFDVLAQAQLSPELLADPDNLLFIAGMSLRTPAGRTEAMNFDPAGGSFWFYAGAVSASALNLRYGPGTYRFTLHSLISGDTAYTLALAEDDYPPAPRLLNFTAAQAIDPSQEFVLRWNEFPGAGTREIRLEIAHADTAKVVLAEGPWSGDSTSFRLPAGTLSPDTEYMATLSFTRYTLEAPGADPPSYAGFEAHTEFPLRTRQPGGEPSVRFTGWRRLANGDLELTLAAPAGRPLTLLGAAALDGAWSPLQTVTPAEATAVLVVPAAQLGARQFFRARAE
jgi:hypothetical protein